MFKKLQAKGFQVLALHHAEAILIRDMPDAVKEIQSVLSDAELPVTTRGETLHNAMRELMEAFAVREGIDSIEKLDEYYEPTSKQKANIKKAIKREGSFAKGWAAAFVASKFGEATTHWRKLSDRVSRGVGSPCPLLLIGIPKNMVTE